MLKPHQLTPAAIAATSFAVALLALDGRPRALASTIPSAALAQYSPSIPRTWDDRAIAELEVPLANPVG